MAILLAPGLFINRGDGLWLRTSELLLLVLIIWNVPFPPLNTGAILTSPAECCLARFLGNFLLKTQSKTKNSATSSSRNWKTSRWWTPTCLLPPKWSRMRAMSGTGSYSPWCEREGTLSTPFALKRANFRREGVRSRMGRNINRGGSWGGETSGDLALEFQIGTGRRGQPERGYGDYDILVVLVMLVMISGRRWVGFPTPIWSDWPRCIF